MIGSAIGYLGSVPTLPEKECSRRCSLLFLMFNERCGAKCIYPNLEMNRAGRLQDQQVGEWVAGRRYVRR